jgi:hypothetical protein
MLPEFFGKHPESSGQLPNSSGQLPKSALRLFRDAVRQKRVTADLVRELLAYLKKARLHPKLRFRSARY